MNTHRATLELAVDGYSCEREVTLYYLYHPFCRGGRDSDGQQLEPDEPAWCELGAVEVAREKQSTSGKVIEQVDILWMLSDTCIENIAGSLLGYHEEMRLPDPDHRRDAA